RIFSCGNIFRRALVKQSRGRELEGKTVNRMKIATAFLAVLLLVRSLITGCGCLTAQLRSKKKHFCEEACCAVRESDVVSSCSGASGVTDRTQPFRLGFLLV